MSPCGEAVTGRSYSAVMSEVLASERILRSLPRPATLPTEALRFCAATAAPTCARLRPISISRSWSTITRISSAGMPSTDTLPRPCALRSFSSARVSLRSSAGWVPTTVMFATLISNSAMKDSGASASAGSETRSTLGP